MAQEERRGVEKHLLPKSQSSLLVELGVRLYLLHDLVVSRQLRLALLEWQVDGSLHGEVLLVALRNLDDAGDLWWWRRSRAKEEGKRWEEAWWW